MKAAVALLSAAVASVTLFSGAALAVPYVFADRVLPGLVIGDTNFTGISHQDLSGAVSAYGRRLAQQPVTIALRGQQVTRSLAEFGISLDLPATQFEVENQTLLNAFRQQNLAPIVQIDSSILHQQLNKDFAEVIDPPANASLRLTSAGQLELISAAGGEGVDRARLSQAVSQRARTSGWNQPIELHLTTMDPAVLNDEVAAAREYAKSLLSGGLRLYYEDQEWVMKPFTVRRLLTFVEQAGRNNPTNHVLGVSFNAEGVAEYLSSTIAPLINQPSLDARFERDAGANRVTQFEFPQDGQNLDIGKSAQTIAAALAQHDSSAALAIEVTKPAIQALDDIEALGVTTLLAKGESDFAGSPPNRVHNIVVGTEKYHGLLIPPGSDFSFNEALGPVDGSHGFLPELVIKSNVTVPEFGGGLCQVSTTAFRAAINSGLEITKRRNHSYAVSYYGEPGFDATIYPPYTDLRFSNNTPGYILIQARVVGTKVTFEFWGTDDGREVIVNGPQSYDLQADGAVKATLTQKVVKDGSVMIDETFYSRYKSPSLFPKVLAADDPIGSTKTKVSTTPAPPS